MNIGVRVADVSPQLEALVTKAVTPVHVQNLVPQSDPRLTGPKYPHFREPSLGRTHPVGKRFEALVDLVGKRFDALIDLIVQAFELGLITFNCRLEVLHLLEKGNAALFPQTIFSPTPLVFIVFQGSPNDSPSLILQFTFGVKAEMLGAAAAPVNVAPSPLAM